MKHILYKISSPGWTKEFSSEEEAKEELFKYICNNCREEGNEFDDPPINKDSSIEDMLWSPCGCEFRYDEEQYLTYFQ